LILPIQCTEKSSDSTPEIRRLRAPIFGQFILADNPPPLFFVGSGSRSFVAPAQQTAAEETDACFIVRDHNEQALAYVYFKEEPGRRSAAKLLTRDEARAAVKKPRPNRTLAVSRPCTEVLSALIAQRARGTYGGRTQSRRLLTSPTALLSLSPGINAYVVA
jgi:hypothetical protein